MKPVLQAQASSTKHCLTADYHVLHNTIEGFIQHAHRRKRRDGSRYLTPTWQSHFFRIHVDTTLSNSDYPIIIELINRLPSDEPIKRCYMTVQEFHKELATLIEKYPISRTWPKSKQKQENK